MKRRKEVPIPSARQAARGAKLSLENAKRHLKAAEALRDARLYGPGVSHLVLSVEEVSKAWVLTMLAIGLPIQDRLVHDVLNYHDARHAVTLADVLRGGILLVGDRAAKRVQGRHNTTAYPPELRDEWADEVEKEVRALAKRTPSNDPFLALMKWISTSSERKNEGLYVDFGGVRWKQPGRVTKKRFDFDYRIAKGIHKARSQAISFLLRSGARVSDAEKKLYERLSAKVSGASLEESLALMFKATLGPSSVIGGEADT